MNITREEIDEVFYRWYDEWDDDETSEGATETFIAYLNEIRSEGDNDE